MLKSSLLNLHFYLFTCTRQLAHWYMFIHSKAIVGIIPVYISSLLTLKNRIHNFRSFVSRIWLFPHSRSNWKWGGIFLGFEPLTIFRLNFKFKTCDPACHKFSSLSLPELSVKENTLSQQPPPCVFVKLQNTPIKPTNSSKLLSGDSGVPFALR